MRTGFSFKGVHSSSFPNITVRTKDRPIVPSAKTAEYSAANMHGAYDFSDYTGQMFYEMRDIQLDINVIGKDFDDLQNMMSKLSVWLSGSGDLIFDDTPTVKFIARVSDSISYRPEHGRTGMITVSFRCQPFALSLWDVFDGPILDDLIPLDSDIMLDASEYPPPDIMPDASDYLTLTPGTYEGWKFEGDVPFEPVIKCDGYVKITVTNSLGERSMLLSAYGVSGVTIDCVKKQVYCGNQNLMQYVKGEFPILTPDGNKIIVEHSNIEIHYTPKFFFDRRF